MSRYVQEIKVGQPIDVVSMVMEDYVYHHHFRRNDWNGEMVYHRKDKHGKDCYMKWGYTNGVFHMEAWIKNTFGGESDLKGFGNSASKNEFRRSLELLVKTLKNQQASAVSSGHVGSDPLHHSANHAAEHRAQRQGRQMSFGTMPGGSRNISGSSGKTSDTGNMIYALLALVFSSIPIVGLILAVKCLRRNKGNQGSSGKLINILCVMAIFVSIMTIFTGLLPAMMLPVMDLF